MDEKTRQQIALFRYGLIADRRCCTALAESEIRLWWWPRYVRA